jgi:hypothetical protein
MHLHTPRRSVSAAVVLFKVCPILDSNRDLQVYRDGSILGGHHAHHFTPHIRCLDCDADALMCPGGKRLYVAGAACTGCQSKAGA